VGAGDGELHAQLGVELVVEGPLGRDIRVPQLSGHGCLQAVAELHLHLSAHGEGGEEGCGVACWVQGKQACSRSLFGGV
jgi:hypothetical protein